MGRRTVSTGARWEDIAGYSRAVRVGDRIWVTGTTSLSDGGELLHPGDAAAQAGRIFEIIEAALAQLGGSLDDIVRTRMFVVDIARDWEGVARVHGARLGHVRPATSMVEVRSLIDPGMLVEIEADAVVGAGMPDDGSTDRCPPGG